VVGRNGSGKSSFAEGAEVLLTGTSLRWEGRTKAWMLGWRTDTAAVSAELVVSAGPLTATRTWPAEGDLGAGVVSAVFACQPMPSATESPNCGAPPQPSAVDLGLP
jgi:hypothetical protein